MKDYIYLIAPVAGYLVAQAIKFVVSLRKDGIGWNDLVQSGGMPSAHSSFMTSISTVIALNMGIDSVHFGLALTMTAIVLYDSIGVRRAAGENTVALRELSAATNKPIKTIHLSKGHSPIEVASGSLLGVFIGLALNLLV